MRHELLVSSLLLLVACGGELISGSDAGGSPDSSGPGGGDSGLVNDASVHPDASPPPPPPQCGSHSGFGTTGPSSSCQRGENWSCGGTQYSVTCTCPDAVCQCVVGNGAPKTVKYPSGCPSCSSSGPSFAALCNFPQ